MKTVGFSINSTNSSSDLQALNVISVRANKYTENTLPLWAVEKAQGYDIKDTSLMWGLVDESQANNADVS